MMEEQYAEEQYEQARILDGQINADTVLGRCAHLDGGRMHAGLHS